MSTTRAPAPAIWLVAGVGASLCAAVALPVAAVSSGPTLCPFRLLTGWPCPTCGMTRAWVLLGHGRWSEAMALNPMTAPVLAVTALWFVLLVWHLAGRAHPAWFGKLVVPLLVAAVGIYGFTRVGLVATGGMHWSG